MSKYVYPLKSELQCNVAENKQKRKATEILSAIDIEADFRTLIQSQFVLEKNINKKKAQEESASNALCAKPWMYCTEFPRNWQKEKDLLFDGVSVNKESLETLLPHKYIDDAIIDSFAAVLMDDHKDSNILYFGVHNVKTLMENNESMILKWSQRIQPSRFSVWILPLHHTLYGVGHWTLFVVLIQKKLIVYLDSFHAAPDVSWIEKLCAFIDRMHDVPQNWSEWNLHAPNDIPEQGGVDHTSGNCGPHICTWCYIIYTGQNFNFSETDMNQVRSCIMSTLIFKKSCDNRNLKYINKRSTQQITSLPKINADFNISRVPPCGFNSTFNFCASLNTSIG